MTSRAQKIASIEKALVNWYIRWEWIHTVRGGWPSSKQRHNAMKQLDHIAKRLDRLPPTAGEQHE